MGEIALIATSIHLVVAASRKGSWWDHGNQKRYLLEWFPFFIHDFAFYMVEREALFQLTFEIIKKYGWHGRDHQLSATKVVERLQIFAYGLRGDMFKPLALGEYAFGEERWNWMTEEDQLRYGAQVEHYLIVAHWVHHRDRVIAEPPYDKIHDLFDVARTIHKMTPRDWQQLAVTIERKKQEAKQNLARWNALADAEEIRLTDERYADAYNMSQLQLIDDPFSGEFHEIEPRQSREPQYFYAGR